MAVDQESPSTIVRQPLAARIPKLDFRKLSGAGATPAPGTGRVEDFNGFWESPAIDELPGSIRIGTPRHLEVFKIDSPRDASEQPGNQISEFSPPWPYWNTGLVPTTLELSGLPQQCNTSVLATQLDEWGFAGLYNFIHVPVNPSTGRAFGGALVNATSHAHGCAIAGRLQGFQSWPAFSSRATTARSAHKSARRGGVQTARTSRSSQGRRCCVLWSHACQGLEQLILQYQVHPDGSSSGPWLLLGNEWITMPQSVPWHQGGA